MTEASKPHFAILGAGPIGLDAALATAAAGYDFTLYEAAPRVAGHVRDWGHVRLFTPWSMNASPRMRAALDAAGHDLPPDDACPTGHELAEHLLEPVAALPEIGDRLRLDTRVVAVGRQGLLKHEAIGDAERGNRPFRLLLRGPDGRERIESADVVFDCTGNTVPNALGDAGIPAPGESGLGDRIHREVPDLAREADTFRGRATLLVGGGHSAQTALRDLLELAEGDESTRIVWVLRGFRPQKELDDLLPERRELTDLATRTAESPSTNVEVRVRRAVESLEETDDGRLAVTLRTPDDNLESVTVDQVLALTGRVGDHLLYRQLQVHECYATSGPMKLAAALLGAGGGGDCLEQTSLGAETLRSPEPGFFLLGSKSYGRRNDFLLRVGWQQVDEVFQLLD